MPTPTPSSPAPAAGLGLVSLPPEQLSELSATQVRRFKERRNAVTGADPRPVAGCGCCFPKDSAAAAPNDEDQPAYCDACAMCFSEADGGGRWTMMVTTSGYKFVKEGDDGEEAVTFSTVPGFLRATTSAVNAWIDSQKQKTAQEQDASALDAPTPPLRGKKLKRPANDDGEEAAGPSAKKPKAAVSDEEGEKSPEAEDEGGEGKGGEGKENEGKDEAGEKEGAQKEEGETGAEGEEDAKALMESLFEDGVLESEENIEKNVAPAVEEAKEASERAHDAVLQGKNHNVSLVKAKEATAREELLEPIKFKIEALEAEKEGIQESVEEYEDDRRYYESKYGVATVAGDVTRVQGTWAAELKAVDDKLADERASLEKVEGIIAEGVKKMSDRLTEDLRGAAEFWDVSA